VKSKAGLRAALVERSKPHRSLRFSLSSWGRLGLPSCPCSASQTPRGPRRRHPLRASITRPELLAVSRAQSCSAWTSCCRLRLGELAAAAHHASSSPMPLPRVDDLTLCDGHFRAREQDVRGQHLPAAPRRREMTEELRRAPHARAPPISVLSQHRAMQTAATPRADTVVVSCGGPRVSAAARAFCGNCRNVIVVRRYGPISAPRCT
jgi:hypothetical protein